LETLQTAFNISLMHNKLCCLLWQPGGGSGWWRHTPVVARIMREI